MYWADGTGKPRLERVKDAAKSAIEKLKPNDRIAFVPFAHGADLALPLTALSDIDKIQDSMSRIDQFNVDQAGTAIDEGIELALATLEKEESSRTKQIVLLTDGETTGEAKCRDLAKKAKEANVRLSIMGVGTEWNSGLIKEMAKLADGRWYFIDAESNDEAKRVFAAEFERLAASTFENVSIEFKPMKDIKVRRLRQVSPTIRDVALEAIDERRSHGMIGSIERNAPTKFVVDLSLPRRPDGKYVVANFEIRYDEGNGQMQSTGAIPLEIAYTASGNGYVNAEVARHIDEVQIFELNSNLQKAIAEDDTVEVRRAAEHIAKKATVLGPRGARKTQLAQQVLNELDGAGKVSRRTMLAVDDSVRESSDH
jgi:hypothetical protein